MLIKIHLVFEDEESGLPTVQEVAQLERRDLSPTTLVLTLSEAKTLLHRLQSHLVEQQVSVRQRQQLPCPSCQQPRRVKDNRHLVYRSLFGRLILRTLSIICHTCLLL